MTLPHERINALRATHRFLLDLLDPKETPKVPRAIRRRASACLKHYPWLSEIDELETSGLPDFDTKAHAKALKQTAKALSSHSELLSQMPFKKTRTRKTKP